MEKILEPYWWEENSSRHHPISEHNLAIQSVFRLARKLEMKGTIKKIEDFRKSLGAIQKEHNKGRCQTCDTIRFLQKIETELLEVQKR